MDSVTQQYKNHTLFQLHTTSDDRQVSDLWNMPMLPLQSAQLPSVKYAELSNADVPVTQVTIHLLK